MKTKYLNEVAEIRAGNSAPQGEEPFNNGRFNFYRTFDVGQVKQGEISVSRDKVNKETYTNLKKFQINTILFPKSGASTFNNNRVIIKEEGAIASHLAGIKANPEILNDYYLYYFLLTIDAKDLVQDSAYPSVNLKQISQIEIPVPSLQEQEKIVERLDKVFENINIDLSTTKKMIKYNDSLKQSRIDYLFKSISDKSDKFKLSELGELITGNTPNTQEKDNYGNAIPFIKPGDFNQDGGLNYNNQGLSKKGKLKARLVNKNSVLMVCIGATIGKVGITSKEITTNQQINSIVPSNKIDSYFLYYQMLTTKFQKLVLDSSSQATLPIINKKKWGQIIVDVPTKTIQKESAKALDHFIFLNNELNLKFKLKIKLLKELKKSILIKEFSNE